MILVNSSFSCKPIDFFYSAWAVEKLCSETFVDSYYILYIRLLKYNSPNVSLFSYKVNDPWTHQVPILTAIHNIDAFISGVIGIILKACQSIKGYFFPRGEGITFILCVIVS